MYLGSSQPLRTYIKRTAADMLIMMTCRCCSRYYPPDAIIVVALLLLDALQLAASGLKYLSYYGNNVSEQHAWLSLAISHVNTTEADDYHKFAIPSLIRLPELGVFTRGTRFPNGSQATPGGMLPGWEAVVGSFAKTQVQPRLQNKTAIGGEQREASD